MSVFRSGAWQINSVLVNQDQTVLNDEGFRVLEVAEESIAIEPAGLRFKVQQKTSNSAVLESSGRVYFADWVINEDNVRVKFSRPEMEETISISAVLEPSEVMVN